MTQSLRNTLSHLFFRSILAVRQSGHHKRLIKATATPQATQHAALMAILQKNAHTEIGKQYGFSDIKTGEDYAKAVPIQTYENLRERIDRQEATGESCLTADQPIYYQRTSGTTNAPKHIPMTQAGMNRIRDYQSLAAYGNSRTAQVFMGKIFGVTGQAVEEKCPAALSLVRHRA
ncbi:MAG: GH3 auxin-responsive promoter family protein [Sneathiella sp.]|nr:GH3 auxin-responsive promoter family protein [Sneathiella sp.]